MAQWLFLVNNRHRTVIGKGTENAEYSQEPPDVYGHNIELNWLRLNKPPGRWGLPSHLACA